MKAWNEFRKTYRRYRRKWKRSPQAEIVRKVAFVLFVLVCFPVGLYLLWTRKRDWPLLVRCGMTAVIAAIAVSAVAVSLPKDPYHRGGVEYVNVAPKADVYMPYVPEEDVSVLNYNNAYSAESVILLPTATPVPIYVWCNDMGKYYHLETCHYVKETTPRVTLQQALIGGFNPCKECNPPVQ